VDYRSFHLNFELVVMVADPAFCGRMEAMMRDDFARSRRVDPGEYGRRPWWFKSAVRMARLLSPVE
jgi:cardiolipin synthase